MEGQSEKGTRMALSTAVRWVARRARHWLRAIVGHQERKSCPIWNGTGVTLAKGAARRAYQSFGISEGPRSSLSTSFIYGTRRSGISTDALAVAPGGTARVWRMAYAMHGKRFRPSSRWDFCGMMLFPESCLRNPALRRSRRGKPWRIGTLHPRRY